MAYNSSVNIKLDGYTSSNEILDKPYDASEVVFAMKHLKAGKAAGDDNIKLKSDFILRDENNLKHVLTLLFSKLYETGSFPSQWSTGVIVPILKSGEKKDPGNYRWITLTSTLGKLFTYILNKRLTAWCKKKVFYQKHNLHIERDTTR